METRVAIALLALCLALETSGGAAGVVDRYAQTISSERGLAAYWRMEGDLSEEHAQTEQAEVKYGRLEIRELIFELPEAAKPGRVAASVDGQEIRAKPDLAERQLRLTLAEALALEAGSSLKVRTALRDY